MLTEPVTTNEPVIPNEPVINPLPNKSKGALPVVDLPITNLGVGNALNAHLSPATCPLADNLI